MVFNSLSFLLFFPVVFLLYYYIPKKFQWVLLLIASYYFYMSWKPAYVVVIFLTTVVTYFSAIYIEKTPKKKSLILFGFLVINLGILFVFKYFNLFALSFSLPIQFKLLLPIGISFYTFQTISYVIDVYKGKQKAETHFGIFALFVSFFPQLVAGPIPRSSQLLPQFYKKHEFEYEGVSGGLKLFGLGLFKKVVIADNLGLVVDRVFGSLPEYKGLSLIMTIFFFSWQIYADFSGYTDMARGVAKMLGFNFVQNFNSPYFATSVGDFWRRWHISLSSWFKDYVYIPLGGNRQGLIRTCINTLIVFFLCGLWHGAAWHFALWGIFHGVFNSIERILAHFNKRKWIFPKPLSMLYAYGVISVSWVLFRASNLTDAVYILRSSISGIKNFISPNYISATAHQLFKNNVVEMYIALFCIVSIISIEIVSYNTSLASLINKRPPIIRWCIYITLASLIMLLRNGKIAEFIYRQF